MLPIAKEFLVKNIPNDSGKKWLDGIEYNISAKNLYNKLKSEGLFEGSVEEYIELSSKEKQHLLDYADRNGHIVRLEELVKDLLKKPNKAYKKGEVLFGLDGFNKNTRIILGSVIFSGKNISKNVIQLTDLEWSCSKQFSAENISS
jgi:hypothetical protein